MADWRASYPTQDDYAPIEHATRIHHSYLAADPKMIAAFGGRIYRLDHPQMYQFKTERLPALFVTPHLIEVEPVPGEWKETVRIRDIVRIEFKGQEILKPLAYDSPGVATLLNSVRRAGLAAGARQLKYVPDGKTQQRPLGSPVALPTLSADPIEVKDTAKVTWDYYIDFEYVIAIQQNGWQPAAQVSP